MRVEDQASARWKYDWRAEALRQTSRLLVIVTVPVGLLAIAITGTAHVVAIRVEILCVLAVTAFVAVRSANPRHYRVLAALQLATAIQACLTVIVLHGLGPGTAIGLATAVLVVGIFLGRRALWVATVTTTLLLVGIGAAVHAGVVHLDPASSTLDWNRMSTWLKVSVFYFLTTSTVSAWVASLISRLERGLVAERQALEAARQAIRVREEFLAIAAHELRTPLTSLRLALQSLSRQARQGKLAEAETERAPSIEGKVDVAERQADSLNLLVDRLLDVSSVTSESMHIALSEVDLADAVQTVVARLNDPLRASGSRLTLDAREPIVGRWDRSRVEQVVTHLLSNAIKYGRGKPIEVGVRADGEVARLVVEDHGEGIAPEERARIFGRFERAASSHNYGGLGLGLYIVQRNVERLGGTVECAGAAPEGSTFTVTLPRKGPSAAAAA